MISFLKDALLPGTFRLLILGLVIGVALMRAPGAWGRWARRWLVLLAVMYTAMSIPALAIGMAAPLQSGWMPLGSRDAARGASAVVVLGGGVWRYRGSGYDLQVPGAVTVRRLLEAARLYRLLDSPWIVVSGGVVPGHNQSGPESDSMKALLVTLGVPAERIVIEAASRNTREQAIETARVLERLGARQVVLVSSPVHLPRATRLFHAAGVRPIPSATGCCAWDGRAPGVWMWWLNDGALQLSTSAVYEYAALSYYWLRDWI